MWSRWSRWSGWSGWSAKMICIQKIYGFHGLKHQIIEESWELTLVTEEDGGKWKIVQYSGRPEKPQKRDTKIQGDLRQSVAKKSSVSIQRWLLKLEFACNIIFSSALIFLGPKSDQCLPLSPTHRLTHSLLLLRLDWCDSGFLRCQLKTFWGC